MNHECSEIVIDLFLALLGREWILVERSYTEHVQYIVALVNKKATPDKPRVQEICYTVSNAVRELESGISEIN